jgi:hypothetical protein
LWKFLPKTKRQFPDNPLIHQSVIDRMNAASNTYSPWPGLPEKYRIEPW